MRNRRSTTFPGIPGPKCRGALMCAMGLLLPLSAAEPARGLRASASLRTGLALNPQDHLAPGTFGFGFGVEHPLTPPLGLSLEATYLAQPGRTHRVDPLAPAVGQAAADPALSADGRRNSLDVLALRASVHRQIVGDLWVNAGLQFGRARFGHEYLGQSVGPKQAYLDTYNGTPTASVLRLSPFVGGQWRLDADSSLELTALAQGYQALAFQHTPGAPLVAGDPKNAGSHLVYAGDHLARTTRTSLVLEAAYRFRF